MDDPKIIRTMQTGYPDEEIELTCPVCHEPCEILFESRDGIVFGCDVCVERRLVYCV